MNAELAKFLLALLVVSTSLVLTILYALGKVTVSPELAILVGYLIGEARRVLSGYFKSPKSENEL